MTDHSHHADHGHMPDMDHGHMCSMNMLFTWSTKDLCIVFRSWHVDGVLSLLLSLAAIVALGAGYEAVRELSRRYDATVAASRIDASPTEPQQNATLDESSSLLAIGSRRQGANRTSEVIKAIFYGLQVFYSFFIMLIFMTYNGWVMIAVAVGASIGHYAFGLKTATSKSVACH